MLCVPSPLHRAVVKPDLFDALLQLLRSALAQETPAPTSSEASSDASAAQSATNTAAESLDSSDACLLLRCLRLLLHQNPAAHAIMVEQKGWELLGWLLREHGRLTDAKLQLFWGLVGVPVPLHLDHSALSESAFQDLLQRGTLANLPALRFLLLDFGIWRRAPVALQLRLFRQLRALVSSSQHRKFNLARLRKVHLLPNLCLLLRDETLELPVHLAILHVIQSWLQEGVLFRGATTEEEDLRVLTTLLQFTLQPRVSTHPRSVFARRMVRLRNEVLNLLLQLVRQSAAQQLHTSDPHHAAPGLSLAALTRHIDATWLHALVVSVDPLTVTLTVKILAELFRLDKKWAAKYRAAGGLKYLYEALPKHHERPELYFVLLCLLFGRPIGDLTRGDVVGVGELERHIIADFATLPETFARREGDRLKFACKEALNVIFHMLRRALGVVCAHLMKTGAYPPALLQPHSPTAATSLVGGSPISPRRHSVASTLRRARSTPQQGLMFEMDLGSTSASSSAHPAALNHSNSNSSNSTPRQAHQQHGRLPSHGKWEAPQPLSPEESQRLFPQKQLFDFLRHVFTLSKHFQEALWRDKSELMEDVVAVLFPLGRLNLLRFTQDAVSLSSSSSSSGGGTTSPARMGVPEHEKTWEEIVADPLVIEWSEAMFDFLQHVLQTIAVQLEAGNISYLQRPNGGTPSLSAAFTSTVSTPRDVSLLFNLFEWGPPASTSPEDLVFFTSRLLADALTLWMTSGGAWLRKDIKSNPKIATTIGRLLTFAVDRCSMGLFLQDGHHVLFEFVVDFLGWALFDETAPRMELGPYLRALNRLTLLMLRHAAHCIGLRLFGDAESANSDSSAAEQLDTTTATTSGGSGNAPSTPTIQAVSVTAHASDSFSVGDAIALALSVDAAAAAWNGAVAYGVPVGGVPAATLTLDRLISFQRVVFAAPNTEFDFLASLARSCLTLLLCSRDELRLRAMQLWKLLLLTKPDACERMMVYRVPKGNEVIDLRQTGFALLLQRDVTAFQKWFADKQHREQVTLVLEDSLTRLAGSLDKAEASVRANRLSAMDATRRARIKAAQKLKQTIDALAQSLQGAVAAVATKVMDVDVLKYKQWKLAQLDQAAFVGKKWALRASALVRDGGAWSPARLALAWPALARLLPSLSALYKWQLDDTESPNRMRAKLQRNWEFFENYPFLGDLQRSESGGTPSSSAEDDMSTGATRVPTSKDSRRWFLLRRQLDEAAPLQTALILHVLGEYGNVTAQRALTALNTRTGVPPPRTTQSATTTTTNTTTTTTSSSTGASTPRSASASAAMPVPQSSSTSTSASTDSSPSSSPSTTITGSSSGSSLPGSLSLALAIPDLSSSSVPDESLGSEAESSSADEQSASDDESGPGALVVPGSPSASASVSASSSPHTTPPRGAAAESSSSSSHRCHSCTVQRDDRRYIIILACHASG